jgi:hypothetical protein
VNCLVRYSWRDISGSQKKGIKKAEDFAVLRFEKGDIRGGEGERGIGCLSSLAVTASNCKRCYLRLHINAT